MAIKTTIQGYEYTDIEIAQYQGIASAPSTSTTGKAKFYFDSTNQRMKLSENGGAWYYLPALNQNNTWTGVQEISLATSNSSPNTTRHIKLSNTGSYTWIDGYFSGTIRTAIGMNSSGGIDAYTSGGNGFAFYSGNSGLTSNSLYSYNYPSYFYHGGNIQAAGNGMFGGRVGAGTGSSTTPTSFLQVAGGTALKVKRVTASQSLDDTATQWLADATNASACSGTPSQTACSTYTASGQATCESHLPCTWYAGSSCSAFDNESGMSSCSGTSGCSVVTSSCSGYDQSSCEANDDAYGGSCAWTLGSNTCSSYTDTSSCNGASPCYANTSGDCSTLSDGGGDGTSCATQPECSYDSGSGACSGTYFTSCDGDNSTYSCTGTYNTGSCTGTYGASCSGTVTCASYGSSGACAAETGCSWSSVLNLTLPDGDTCPDRTYWIYNDSSGGADVVIIPYSAQTVNNTSSYTLAAYKDKVQLAYFKKTYACNNYTSAGTCTPTGCSIVNAYCSYNSGDGSCTGDSGSVCSAHNSDQSGCEAQQYFSYCDGTEVQSRNWYVMGV